MALVLHHSKAKGTDKVILLGIANHANDDGAWPGVATLAKYANVTDRAVQQSLGRLVRLRELAITPRAGGTWRTPMHRRPNRYDVLVHCPPGCDRSPQHRVRPDDAPGLSTGGGSGVKPTSPGEAHGTDGVKPTSPGGVKPSSPEPSGEPSGNQGVGPQVTPDRAREDDEDDAMARGERHPRAGVPAPPDLMAELRALAHAADTTDEDTPTDGHH